VEDEHLRVETTPLPELGMTGLGADEDAVTALLRENLDLAQRIARLFDPDNGTQIYQQLVGSLPDPIGGVVWLAWDNAATALYTPVYCGVTDLPKSFKIDGRVTGYNRDCAWWAFNHLSTLASQRWGDMRRDVEAVWKPLQKELFQSQAGTEKQALELFKQSPAESQAFLTRYSMLWGERAVQEAWKLGDRLWTKYDEKF